MFVPKTGLPSDDLGPSESAWIKDRIKEETKEPELKLRYFKNQDLFLQSWVSQFHKSDSVHYTSMLASLVLEVFQDSKRVLDMMHTSIGIKKKSKFLKVISYQLQLKCWLQRATISHSRLPNSFNEFIQSKLTSQRSLAPQEGIPSSKPYPQTLKGTTTV